MTVNKIHLSIFIAVPVVLLVTLYIISNLPSAAPMTPDESKLKSFSADAAPLLKTSRQDQIPAIANPISTTDRPEQKKSFPPTALARMAAQPEQPAGVSATGTQQDQHEAFAPRHQVSFIMIQENQRMAIVDGKLLHEGDAHERQKILRIEKGRVLFQTGKGNVWIHVSQ